LWIADTLGELGLWYRLAPVVLVGRSLLPPGGGQNPLEPARLECAIAVGPYTGNFKNHVALLRDAGGLVEVADGAVLADFVSRMLTNETIRLEMARNAAKVGASHEDLPARIADDLLALLQPG
jgi:3-deoxy-D-manno-octulosonic-acid transferase